MQAVAGHTYAQIVGGVFTWQFTSDDLPEWNEEHITAIDITAVSPTPSVGWTFDGAAFHEPEVPTPPPPTADEVLAEKIAQGIAITSTGNPTLNATYALDEASTGQIFQIGLYADRFAKFPSGETVQNYPDITGNSAHGFTVAQFVAFLQVVAPLVSALDTQAGILAHGGSPTWPSQGATIP
jgi:hypothetical protein